MSEKVSLRGRQRQLVQDAVLDAALELFSEHGYGKTTMQMIADEAGIGVATLFRHFKTKAAVIAALVRRDIDDGFAASQAVIDNPPGDLIESTRRFFLSMLPTLEKRSKRIKLKPYFWLAMPTGRAEIDEVVLYADAKLRQQILELLQKFRRSGELKDGVDLDDAAAVVFHFFNGHYINFTSGATKSRKTLEADISRRVPLLFESWRA